MPSSLTREKRARRYLQASMSAGYEGLPAEHREAYEEQMRSHERAYKDVRKHALAGAETDFDEPLTAGEREHQKELRRREGMQQSDVVRARSELRGDRARPRAARRRSSPRSAGPRAARAAAGAAGGALGGVTGGGGNTVMYFVGLTLGLSLIYLLVAGKGAGVLTTIVNTLVGGVRAFVAPVDPIKAAESALGAGPVSSAAAATGSAPSSSSSGSAPGTPSGVGYVAPFSGATPGRVDQGQDFSLQPGAPIKAIGDAKVTAIIKDWFKGQPLVAYQLSSGPAAGRTVYVAEQITPSVRVGQRIAAGQVIGQYAASGTGIETGWARPSGETLAHATGGYIEGEATPAGQSFKSFLSSLGV